MASTFTLFYTFFAAVVISSVYAEEYAVGGVFVGWKLPVLNATKLYTVWASRRNFYVGDSLRFRYEAIDSVFVVEKYGFYHCDPSKPIAHYHDGDTLITLDKPGTMYFITDDVERCKQGVNMLLEVKGTNPSAPENPQNLTAPPPPPVSNPPENPTPTPPVTSKPPPPPPSVSNPSENPTPTPPVTNKPPPIVSTPPENTNSSVSPPPSPSDAVTSFAVTKSVTAFIVGLGVWALKA